MNSQQPKKASALKCGVAALAAVLIMSGCIPNQGPKPLGGKPPVAGHQGEKPKENRFNKFLNNRVEDIKGGYDATTKNLGKAKDGIVNSEFGKAIEAEYDAAKKNTKQLYKRAKERLGPQQKTR